MSEKLIDVLIIGAGPSGCVAAAYLQQQNKNIVVVEKSKFPRFVIGESLIPRCMDHFEEVGLLDAIKTKGYEKKYGARFIKGNDVCHFDFSQKFTEGWDWTWQVPRADFDNTLATAVQNKGVPILFEWEVIDVAFNNSISTTTLKSKNGEIKKIKAKHIIDSSGYGRVLPRLLKLDAPSELPKHSSIFTHVKDINRPEGQEGTLITFEIIKTDVWLWVIPFSNGDCSIGFVGPTTFIDSFKGDAAKILSELLKLSKHYRNRFSDLPYKYPPVKINNYSKSVKQLYGKGYTLTGNSSEFLDPVFSSGVSFATESGLLAAKLVTKEQNGEVVDWENEYTKHIKEGVAVFATYVKEWYTGNLQKLFFHQPENPEIKRKICAVLAGYVWDKNNPFVKKHNRVITSFAHLIDMEVADKNTHTHSK